MVRPDPEKATWFLLLSPEVEASVGTGGRRLSDMGTKRVLVVAVIIGSDLVGGVLIVISSKDSVVVVVVVLAVVVVVDAVVLSMTSKEI